MVLIFSEKLHVVFCLSIGLLSVLLLTECDKIRLVGPSRCSGRVEVFHEESWGTVCDDHWSIASASVACREVNCGTAIEAKKSAFFGEGKDEIWLDDVQCSGHETSIVKCSHRQFGVNNCGHGEDAGVVCAENVRLNNGSHRCSGNVEVFHNGHWKPVCSTDWGRDEAEVVCREVSCGIPMTPTSPVTEERQILTGVKARCSGNETSIGQCNIEDFRDSCTPVTIFCANSKPIRLVNGTNRCSGRVEVYHDGQWGTVCDDRWGMQEAAVSCQEMNCGTALSVKYKAFFGRGHDQVWLDDIECIGHEKSLADCPHRGFGEHDCDHNEDAGVICSESVRLSNGTDRCSGRVEVFHNGHWGKICSENWGNKEASIVCKELSCGAPKNSRERLNFGETSLMGYISSCSDDVSSISQCKLQEQERDCEGASISCAGNPPIRLVNGTDRCSGRVEILHDGQWGTVCDDEWDIRDAQVVCRSMDCGTAQTVKNSAFFGQGQGDIWLDDVNCFGNETSLIHCQRPSIGENNCGHGEDAGVICSADIRLVNGTGQCSGRMEVYYNGRWSSAYNLNWGTNEATVVCRQMNCGDSVPLTRSYGRSVGMQGYRIRCSGTERSITDCTFMNHVITAHEHIEEAAVECSGNVKLAGGPNRCVGRVEYYANGQWGTVCGEYWDINDATVVCRQLDCGRAHKITTMNEYGLGTGKSFIDQIECNGMETTLPQCHQRPFTDRTCNATSVGGVVCTGSLEVRLANGKDECSGRVEVRHGEVWQTVCDTDWTLSNAEVVCAILECGRAISAQGGAHFGQGRGPVVESGRRCFNDTASLKQCSLSGFRTATCGHERDAGASCAAQIRLEGGSGQCSGRVELFYKGQWGTVCDDEWEMSNADVVCRQLGCGHAVSAPTSAHFGRGSGPIWLDNVECTGQESALTHCMHPGFGENNCGHGEDAGVICLGALQKPQITVVPAAEVNFGDRVEITCTVVTEHLGGTFFLKTTQGSFEMERFSEHEAATFVFPAVDFNQKGSYFCEYHKKLPNQVIYFPQGNVVDLTVTVKLEKPSISLTSPHAMVVFSPDKVSVNKGNSFSVTCSTHSRYPGGYFYLMKSNMTATETKPAFGHSIFYLATFEFPQIDDNQQGDYTCVFGVNISSLSFCSSPSKSLQVIVVSTTSSSVVGAVVGVVIISLLLMVVGFLVWRRRWRGSGVMVQFSNRFGEVIKHDRGDRSNGALDLRGRGTPAYERQHSLSLDEKNADADSESTAEKVPEDLSGKMCYDRVPLVHS